MIRKTLLTMLLCLPMLAQAQTEPVNQVEITAKIRTYVLKSPRADAEFLRGLTAGASERAFGRDASGDWLRILDGWVLAEVFRAGGDMAGLPDATHSVNVTVSSAAQLYDGPSAKWFEATGEMTAGSKAVAIGRNESGSWLRLPQGWIEVAHVEAAGDIRPLPVAPSGVIITATQRTFILAEPDLSAEFVDVFEEGEEALAIGRVGDWLQIAQGWVSAAAVDAIREAESLPYSGDGIMITKTSGSAEIRSGPSYVNTTRVGQVQLGQAVQALGRNEDGTWLQLTNGWIFAGSVQNLRIEFEGDLLDLPVTDGSATSRASSARATATPRPATRSTSSSWTSSTIRSLVSRHTDDIRILDLELGSSVTTIEYDLKPWPFVPNEQIANEVAFKIICALRRGQQIPNTLKLIGQGHFKSDIGRKFKSPSVEIHVRANNANRIICAGNSYSDINWRSLSSVYKSYPIPRGAKVDYD